MTKKYLREFVENGIKQYNGELSKRELHNKLRFFRSYSYTPNQTYEMIELLHKENKIIIDRERKLVWIRNPKLFKRLMEMTKKL